MYISRFFIKSAPPSLNSLDFFHLHLLAFTFSTMINVSSIKIEADLSDLSEKNAQTILRQLSDKSDKSDKSASYYYGLRRSAHAVLNCSLKLTK